MKSIGTQIKELRTNQNLTQKELAEKLQVSRSAITNWENDRNYPDIQVIVNISELFDVSLNQLLKGDQDVVEKISKDTKMRKKQTKQLRVFYFLTGVIVVLVLFFGVPRIINKDMSEGQFKSMEVEGKHLIIETDLPFYRNYSGYSIANSENPWLMDIKVQSTIDFTKQKEQKIIIPIEDDLFNNKYGINFVDGSNKVIKTLRLDSTDK